MEPDKLGEQHEKEAALAGRIPSKWCVLVSLAAFSCGDGSSDTGPAPPGGGAGSGTGGSGAVAGSGTSLPKCYALCAWEVQIAGDCPADANEQCQAAFRVGAYGKDATCVETMETWCECLQQYADPEKISCGEGPVTSNIPVLNGAPTECDAETDAWVKCNQ